MVGQTQEIERLGDRNWNQDFEWRVSLKNSHAAIAMHLTVRSCLLSIHCAMYRLLNVPNFNVFNPTYATPQIDLNFNPVQVSIF